MIDFINNFLAWYFSNNFICQKILQVACSLKDRFKCFLAYFMTFTIVFLKSFLLNSLSFDCIYTFTKVDNLKRCRDFQLRHPAIFNFQCILSWAKPNKLLNNISVYSLAFSVFWIRTNRPTSEATNTSLL